MITELKKSCGLIFCCWYKKKNYTSNLVVATIIVGTQNIVTTDYVFFTCDLLFIIGSDCLAKINNLNSLRNIIEALFFCGGCLTIPRSTYSRPLRNIMYVSDLVRWAEQLRPQSISHIRFCAI